MRKGSKSGGSRSPRLSRTERAKLLARLRRDAKRIAAKFGLTYTAIEAEAPRVKRRYGACFSDGRIKIRLSHARTGRPLKYSSMIDTLCHELAHLKHFNHGRRFRVFYQEILAWAREAGIYQPAPRVASDPFGAQAVSPAPGARERLAELMGTVFAAASSEHPGTPAQDAVALQASVRPGGLVHAPDRGAREPAGDGDTQEPAASPENPPATRHETAPMQTPPAPERAPEPAPEPAAERATEPAPERAPVAPRARKKRRTYEQMWLFQ